MSRHLIIDSFAGGGVSGGIPVLDLFSGIGGFGLGLERAGSFQIAAHCEAGSFQRRVLAKHWPEVPCYHDIHDLTADRLRTDGIHVRMVCGGFPCQPFSTASRGRRVAVDLWPEMLRIIAEVRPAFVVAENVQAEAVARAENDLRGLRYGTDRRRISASDLGADHQRNRWWLCAYADHESQFPRHLNAEVARLQAVCRGLWGAANYARAVRVPDGIPHRVERTLALGNAVLPQIPEAYGRAILASIGRESHPPSAPIPMPLFAAE